MNALDEFRDELAPIAVHNRNAIDPLTGAQDDFSPQSESLRFRIKSKTDVLVFATADRAACLRRVYPHRAAPTRSALDPATEKVFEIL